MLWLILSLTARADTFTLDNGSTLEGALAEYNLNGSCQVSVARGPLAGALVVLPCQRIASFERAPLSEEAALTVSPVEEVPLALPIEEAPFASTPPAGFEEEEAVAIEAPPAAEEEVLWADESGQPAEGTVAAPGGAATTERSVGGVVLPALPNLRVMRQAREEAPPAEPGEPL